MHVHAQDDGGGGCVSPVEIPAAHAVDRGGKMAIHQGCSCRRCNCGGHPFMVMTHQTRGLQDIVATTTCT